MDPSPSATTAAAPGAPPQLTRSNTMRSTRSTRSVTRGVASTPSVLLRNDRARTARRNMSTILLSGWSRASGHSRAFLIALVAFYLGQVALPTVALAMSASPSPVTGQSGLAACPQLAAVNFAIGLRSLALAFLAPAAFAVRQLPDVRHSPLPPELKYALQGQELLRWATAVLFILSNFWVFMDYSAPRCTESPILVSATVCWIMITYIAYLLPLILCFLLILFLPVLLFLSNHPYLHRFVPQSMRTSAHRMSSLDHADLSAAGLTPWAPQPPRGLNPQDLALIETVVFRPAAAGVGSADAAGVGGESEEDLATAVASADFLDHVGDKPSPSPARRDLPPSATASPANSDSVPLHPLSSSRTTPEPTSTSTTSPASTYEDASPYRSFSVANEDASCVICFEDYEDGALLHLFACGHHYHAGCSADWLSLSKLCPLCKASVEDMVHGREPAAVES
ncbi:hypothetical protein H9P43_002909 [Blastocladiella emersonii ATCC 22665]|nr:hypothetical protein H9P43_002909 [Blastocladiella emersonii ATCC 22665]